MKFSNHKYSTVNYSDPMENQDLEQFVRQTDYRANNPYYQAIQNNPAFQTYNACQYPSMSAYSMPAGVPMLPLYGYDNNDQLDRDCEYMKHMYPRKSKQVLKHVEEACDKLEYEGSCMFDNCPDKVYLSIIINQIYDKVVHSNEFEDELAAQNYDEFNTSKDGRCKIQNHNPSYYPDGRPDWLRDLIEVMFYNELQNRRRRYRGRRRWY